MLVLMRGGGIGGPVLEKHVPSSGSQRPVGPSHEARWGNIYRTGGGVQDKQEVCAALLLGQGEVGEGVDREVLSQGRGGNSGSPAEGEVY